MRKVLHYKTNYLNKSETFIDRLVRNHHHFEPAVLCYRKRAFTEQIDVHEVPASGPAKWKNAIVFHLNRPLPWYRQTIHSLQPDVLHAHFGYDAHKLMHIARDAHIPLVTSFYGSDVSRLPAEFGWKRRYNKLAVLGSAFIAASDFMKKQLEELGFPPEKINVVRFGMKMDDLNFSDEKRDPHSIMMVGRLVEKKGFEYGLRALSKVIKKGHPLSVHIYGNGPLLQKLKQLVVDLGIAEYVIFYGFQPVETILKAHHLHSFLLAPSVTAADGDMEGLPNTILEAMAKGTVVIATRHAAIPEAVIHKQTGFLADEKDIDALAGILEAALQENYDYASIQRNARKIVERDYSIKKMAAGVEAIYHRVINRQ